MRKGQPLFTIYSPDLVTTEQEYLIAKKNQADLKQSSVTGVASGAASLLSAAKDRLLQWEISSSEIATLDTEGRVITDLTINSPVSGYITEKNALPNMYVQPEMHLYTVSDLSDVWVLAQVFQNDAGKIKPTVTQVLPLSDAVKAQQQAATHHTRGKVVLRIADEPKA